MREEWLDAQWQRQLWSEGRYIFGVSTSFVVFSLLCLLLLFFFLNIKFLSLELSPTALSGSTGFPLPNELGYSPWCQIILDKLSQSNHPYLYSNILLFIFCFKINVHFQKPLSPILWPTTALGPSRCFAMWFYIWIEEGWIRISNLSLFPS